MTCARTFAEEWIAAWNAHDFDQILAHYADEFTMTSPLIVERMNEPSGMLIGKGAIRTYWQIGLSATPPLYFELRDVFAGVNGLTLYYRRTSGILAAKVLMFDDEGRVVRGIAHHR